MSQRAQSTRLTGTRTWAGSIAGRLYELYDELRLHGFSASVQRSDFVTRFAAPMVVDRWKEAHGTAPKIRQRLGKPELEILEVILRSGFDQVLGDAAATCRTVMSQVAMIAAERGLPLGSAAFSERTVTWVRGQLVAGRLPGVQECEVFAGELVDTGPAAVLSRREFADAYTSDYERGWDIGGAANLRAHPPSAVGLGIDARPSLVGESELGRRDWSQGTNRPVFERYRLRFKLSARTSPPRCASPTCADHPPAPEVADSALAEVHRACSVYGLFQLGHQQIVRSLADGVEVPAKVVGGWTTWEEWSDPCRPIDAHESVDRDLVDAVSSAIAAWVVGPVGGPLVNTYGYETLTGPLKNVLARKAWMDLLGFERAFADPMRQCGIPRLVRTALYRHVPGAVRDWLDGTIGDPDPELPPPDRSVAESPPVQSRHEAHRATLTLLARHPGIVRKMADGDVSWREDYSKALAAWPVGCLAAGEAFDAIRDLLEGMR